MQPFISVKKLQVQAYNIHIISLLLWAYGTGKKQGKLSPLVTKFFLVITKKWKVIIWIYMFLA
jgi:hypothetical protein